jgi:glycosyltransferase involved in cell wall biosynthesis
MTLSSPSSVVVEIESNSDDHVSQPRLTVVIPCHNEEQVLAEAVGRLLVVFDQLEQRSLIQDASIYFVDDGSSDNTWALIEEFAGKDPRVHGLKLSRNFGQQNAILAGLISVPGDAIISLDADLQDDPAAIEQMICAYRSGAEVVYGVRRSRKSDTSFKRTTAEGYYRLLDSLGVRLVFNHADFRLLSRRVVEELRGCRENNLLLRALIPQLGFRSELVYYDRQPRFAGKTNYSLPRMVTLAFTGITAFSEVPLKLITVLGMIISLFSFALAVWALGAKIFHAAIVPGWASTVIPMYFLGGIQLLCLGVIGQYLAKVYTELKDRPRFIVEKKL